MALHNKINKEELRETILKSADSRTTLSFYKYHQISDPQDFRDQLFREWSGLGVLGRIYVSSEGINAQISVPKEKFSDFKRSLDAIDFLAGVRLNIAIEDDGKSFYVLKIKVREKIVADGLATGDLDLNNGGEHIDAEYFNRLTDQDNTLVIDMRNHYESEVGHFENAICPDVETFRDSLTKVEDFLKGNEQKNIVMYCTGGIRCEKATAFFKGKGFKHLYQLDGGIIEYARQVQTKGLKNKFLGKNFVFDERLGERISDDIIAKCHQCGEACDTHINCANDACHLLFIQCHSCAAKYHHCCSVKCREFNDLPEDERIRQRKKSIFNGTKLGKGRYKANRHGELDLT
ncbi:MAG: rhodanese-related sulfurtransferase [Saprospiraceae bacterium]|nr:rhodanese-related sulfurtransferase [Saprospiraceae bacterium]